MEPDFTTDVTTASLATLEPIRASLVPYLQRDDLTADQLRQAIDRAAEVSRRIDAVRAQQAEATQARERLAAQAAAQGTRAGTGTGGTVTAHARDGQPAGSDEEQEHQRFRSPGAAFLASGVLDQYRTQGGRGRGNAFRFDPEKDLDETRAAITTGNLFLPKTRLPGIVTPPDVPTTILDLIDVQTMTGEVIEWVREKSFTNAAAAVAEGAVKPESTFEWETVTSTASTIAHWVQITRQALSDDSQISGYINGRLTYGLRRVLQSEVLSGTGVSPHLTGILKTAGLGTYTAPAEEQKIVSIRRAMAAAEIAGYPADGVVLHPTDWADIELSLIVTPGGGINAALAQGGVQRTLWGLGVVSAVDITAGEFLLGGFRESVTLWQRTGIEYYLTDSHADFFISNKLVLLAELRAALAVYVPKAITHGTFAVPTP